MNQEEFPTELELAALNAALRGEVPWKAVLRQQIPALRVVRRSYNSAGGVTEFALLQEMEKADVSGAAEYPPLATVRHRSLPQGGDLIVWVKDGVIDALEAVAHGDGQWPKEMNSSDFAFG